MPNLSSDVKTGRIYLRLPEETIEEVNRLAKESGMVPSYFLANALVVGARAMARQLNPDKYIPEPVLEIYRQQAQEASANMAKSMGQAFGGFLQTPAFKEIVQAGTLTEDEVMARLLEGMGVKSE